jgi:hypothetical protein
MCWTMWAASAPTPAITDEGSECNHGSPTAYKPGWIVTPRVCFGYPHSSMMGRSTLTGELPQVDVVTAILARKMWVAGEPRGGRG